MSENARRRGRWPAGAGGVRGLALVFLLAALPLLPQVDTKIQYQNRGNRFEGLKPKPVSGYPLELLSALLETGEPLAGWLPNLHLRFYLPAAEPAFITVRQPRPKTAYYWLDKVTPPPWKPRALNDFSWPTAPVLQNLAKETPADLGVVVRLRQERPSNSERVAPVALFAARPPAVAEGYRFTFKTNGSARITCRIYRGDRAVFTRPQNQEKESSPFTVRWDAKGQPEGEYRLVLDGYFDNRAGDPKDNIISQEVVFYHRVSWR